jgi:transposase
MTSMDAETLPNDITLCHTLIKELVASLGKYEKRVGRLQHTIEQLLRQRYGRRSERLEDVDPALLLPFIQDYLKEQAEQTREGATEAAPEEEAIKEEITYTRDKPKRKKLPAELERDIREYDLDDSEKICDCCGEQLERIGAETSEQLDFIPARVFVVRHVRFKYACKHCEQRVVTADKDRQPIEKGLPAAGLLAHVVVSKYLDHQPLYRLEGILNRHDIDITRSTMCGWARSCADLLEPLYKRMAQEMLQSKVINTDDTPVRVQDKNLDKKTRTGRIWIYCGDQNHPYNVYDYTPNRSRAGPELFLRDYQQGYLQADAYAGYDFIFDDPARDVIELLCWAHARRYFYEARKTAPQLSHTAIAWIKLLYDVEKKIKDLTAEQKKAVRQEKSVVILNDFKNWLLEIPLEQALPQSPIRQAINYALNGWEALCRYTTDGDFSIDNNIAENLMRPIALGRKNWLFFGSDNGGRTAAILFTITQSAKRHGLNVFNYLKDIIARISDHPANHLHELLPDKWAPN